MKILNDLNRAYLWFIPMGVAMFLSLLIVGQTIYNKELSGLAEKGNSNLELYVAYLDGLLGKFESLPEILSQDKTLVDALLNPTGEEKIHVLNRYLETINRISNTSDTYLMDSNGLTIAASNWNEERPFIGRNFSYRPYFKEAMSGILGRYFALGTTSSRRGYYFAYPVRIQNRILGAVVVKINIDPAEEKWRHLNQELLVTDPDGVVFITTNPDWRYKTIKQIDQNTRERIEKSRRYPTSSLFPLDITEVEQTIRGDLLTIYNNSAMKYSTYLVQTIIMSHAGWNVKILSDINKVKEIRSKYVLFTLFVEICFAILTTLFLQRQKKLAQLKKFEIANRKMLQEANEQLESRVELRTSELTVINQRLTNEVNERKTTEEALRKTRKELIHAAKLAALGQMSAGINHEMNQPLAAIRSYAENAALFLDKNRVEETKWNLEQIGELTERMAQVVAQLKLFSRKSSGQLNRLPLHGAIDGALEILKPGIRKSKINIDVSLRPDRVEVVANNVLLQQVFVNLINNAIHAIEQKEHGKIKISSETRNQKVFILVEDNGPGIPDNKLPHIFEPFFTTKISGQGLGLGLTITERILKEVNGKIYVSSSGEGTIFQIILNEA